MDLFYKADDGTYHKLSEIIELEETIMDADDKLFNCSSEANTVRNLKLHDHFEQQFRLESVPKELMDEINDIIEKLIERHAEYYDLMWICELAKRWLKEHVDGSSDLS